METPRQSHRSLIPLETTSANLTDETSAVTLVNFAALFHERIYLTDTVLGDHRLLIESSASTNSAGLYNTVSGMIKAGILIALYRDRVVLRGSTLTASEPTLHDIYEGWQQRDRKEWKNKSGITTFGVDPQLRFRYYKAVHNILVDQKAIARYNPDVTKELFRQGVRNHLGRNQGILQSRVAQLPRNVRRVYESALDDDWFTYAEVWRALKPYLEDPKTFEVADNLIVLHAHLNQQGMADVVGAGQSLESDGRSPIAAFHRELMESSRDLQTVEASLDPPENLRELLDQALVTLEAPAIRLIAQFSVEEIVSLRKHAKELFALTNRSLVGNVPGETDTLRRDYVKELGKYWEYIIETMERKSPKTLKKYPMTIWMEEHAPAVHRAFADYGKPVETMLLRLGKMPGASLVGGTVIQAVQDLSAVVFQEKTDLNLDLRAALPPKQWVPQGILGLEPARIMHRTTTASAEPNSE
jgi:hypothetical protein